MNYLDEIIGKRKERVAFNVPLWSELYQCNPMLTDISDEKLHIRLAGIERNIQFLNNSVSWNDDIGSEYGWQSPWWWFRARQFTLCEFERRGMVSFPGKSIGMQAKLHRSYSRRKKPSVVRISKLKWLSELMEGRIRFGAASSYISPDMNAAQRDDEIDRHTFIPGSFARVTTSMGLSLPLIGEIRLSGSRARYINGKTSIEPYWVLCFSTELDDRLIHEFDDKDSGDEGFLVLFDVEKFSCRISEAAQSFELSCGYVEVDYYDEHFPPDWKEGQFSVIGLKPFRFAYQREFRFFLLPDGATTPSLISDVYLRTEKMHDIAGIYNSNGEKEAGSGPQRLFHADK